MKKVSVVKTIMTAFSMFSKIPVPYFDWDSSNTKYMLLAFPMVGAAVGLCCSFWSYIGGFFDFSNIFVSVLLVLIPIWITGGVHLDGLCDSTDAISSHQPMEKKLAILSDPHIGAFGVIGLVSYILFYFAVMYEMDKGASLIYFLTVPIISRSFSAFGVVVVPPAKKDGLGKTFSDSADKKFIAGFMVMQIIVLVLLICWYNIYAGVFIGLFSCLTYIHWLALIKKEFGGVSGDLSGMLTQKLEVIMFLAVVISQKIEVLL